MTCLTKSRPLAAVFLPKYEKYFVECGIDRLISQFKYPAFQLFSSIFFINITNMSFSWTSMKDICDLFEINFGYHRTELFLYIQLTIFSSHFYPDAPSCETNHTFLSLLETTFLNRLNFVDLLTTASKKEYEAGNYASAYIFASGGFDELEAWIFKPC